MQYIGELISLVVSVLWTISALASEVGSKHLGVYVLNVWRLGLSLLFAGLLLWATMGAPSPVYAGGEAWIWLLLSGVVGYFFGDYCLFSSYLVIGSRFGMLFMTLAPMFTAFFAWLMLGQQLSWKALLAMVVTLSGIAITVFHRGGGHKVSLSLPLKGVLFGLGAALGQGAGLVMSMIGLNHYRADVPSDMLPQMETWLPFAANMIRCLAGTLCFTVCLLWRGEMHLMAESRPQGTAGHALRRLRGTLLRGEPVADGCAVYGGRHRQHAYGADAHHDLVALEMAVPSAHHVEGRRRCRHLVCRRVALLPFVILCIEH